MEKSQLMEYVPVLMLVVLALVFSFGMLAASVLLGKRGQRGRTKDTAYECGMVPVGEGAPRMSIKFHLVAMLFILFDIEVVFLYPWAILFRKLGMFGFVEMMIFMAILTLGLGYVWRKGALEWD